MQDVKDRVERRFLESIAEEEKDEADVSMLTATELASKLMVSASTVRRWSDLGLIKSYRIGPRGDRRFLINEVLDSVEGSLYLRERYSTAF
jgi:hypothetical protein